MFICSICGRNYEGYGNNAEPVNNGRCCDECNATIVVPRRIQNYYMNRKENVVDGNKNI